MFAAAPADENSRELDIHALEVEWYAGAPGGREDAAPVGIGAGQGRFYERRVRDRARDLSRQRDPTARRELQFRLRVARLRHLPQFLARARGRLFRALRRRSCKSAPSLVIFRAPLAPLARIADRVVRRSVAVHRDRVECAGNGGSQRARKQRRRNRRIRREERRASSPCSAESFPRPCSSRESARSFRRCGISPPPTSGAYRWS